MRIKIYIFLTLFMAFGTSTFAQDKKVVLPKNWFNLDLATNGYFGISTEKAYTQLLANKTPKAKIIVAVIDGGTDIKHEDLKDVLWTNEKEIPGNGIDDDGNGYIDDIHGWNFIGSKKGNLTYDNLELVRILKKYKSKFKATIMTTVLDSAEKAEFRIYKRAEIEFGRKYNEASQAFPVYIAIKKVLDTVAFTNKKEIPSLEDIERYKADDEIEEQVKKIIRKGAKDEGSIEKFHQAIMKGYKEIDAMLKYNLNDQYDERAEMVGDDYSNSAERNYGNNDVMGPDADHGTHVSGIIGANRSNEIGILGVANNVSIMTIRVVPQGDERDKDVANGIRYAVDNGARIINMSFGKAFKWDKKIVDEAVKYAESKGVLLVHAAGNDNNNNDVVENYPNKYFESPEAEAHLKASAKKDLINVSLPPKKNAYGTIYGEHTVKGKPPVFDTTKFNLPHANNWIEVGASSYKDNEELKASFSNYGKYNVDVFAPGFMINSSVPGSKYEEYDGTSMAAPVVSGLAALILSYYPTLKPAEVKDIIMKSVTKVNHKVRYKNDKGETVRAMFAELSVSGGIVNAYNALLLADTYHNVN
jgi:cell wall-associated protease